MLRDDSKLGNIEKDINIIAKSISLKVGKFTSKQPKLTKKQFMDQVEQKVKERVGLTINAKPKDTWSLETTPRDAMNVETIDSIDVDINFTDCFDLTSVQHRLDNVEDQNRKLLQVVTTISRPHISNICKEILLFYDAGRVDNIDVLSCKFSNKLPTNKANEIKQLALSLGISFNDFCVKANELIDRRNVLIHPRNLESLRARVAEANVLLATIADVGYTFERYLITYFSTIETFVANRVN
jgi:hypothetical protein